MPIDNSVVILNKIFCSAFALLNIFCTFALTLLTTHAYEARKYTEKPFFLPHHRRRVGRRDLY